MVEIPEKPTGSVTVSFFVLRIWVCFVGRPHFLLAFFTGLPLCSFNCTTRHLVYTIESCLMRHNSMCIQLDLVTCLPGMDRQAPCLIAVTNSPQRSANTSCFFAVQFCRDQFGFLLCRTISHGSFQVSVICYDNCRGLYIGGNISRCHLGEKI